MTLEALKNYASAAKNLALALGVVVGGGWTLWVFHKTLVSQSAIANYEKLSKELAQRPIIEGSLTATTLGDDSHGGRVLEIDVTLEPISKLSEQDA